MDIEKKIESLLELADLYQSQGLLDEAKQQHEEIERLIKENEKSIKNKDLAESASKKKAVLNSELNKVEKASRAPEMSEKFQEVVMDKFSFSEDDDVASLEAAMALIQFGQFERALKELDGLLEKESVRFAAAKSIIRCYIALSSVDEAINRYQEWFSSGLFPQEQLRKLRSFLQGILNKKKIDKILPQARGKAGVEAAETAGEEPLEDEFPPISSIEFALEQGPNKGKTLEFDVHSQSRETISLLISANDQELVELLKAGVTLNEVRYFSASSMFVGEGVVCSSSKIEAGSKQGDLIVDMKVK